MGPDRTVAAREAGNLVVVPTFEGGVLTPRHLLAQGAVRLEPPLRAGQYTASVGWVRLGGGYPRVVGLV